MRIIVNPMIIQADDYRANYIRQTEGSRKLKPDKKLLKETTLLLRHFGIRTAIPSFSTTVQLLNWRLDVIKQIYD